MAQQYRLFRMPLDVYAKIIQKKQRMEARLGIKLSNPQLSRIIANEEWFINDNNIKMFGAKKR